MPALAHSVSLKSIAAVLGGGRAFSPASLFAANEPGGWYDPSDLSTLYQDAAGTTPVTAVEQPVGLVLDKSKGLVLGSELVTNGDFSNGTTGWTAIGGTWTVADGRLKAGNTDAVKRYVQSASSIVSGRWYKVTWNQYAGAGTGAANWTALGVWNGTENLLFGGSYTNGEGLKTIYFIAPVSGQFYIYNFEQEVEYDNISVRELPGNHLSQSTAAARPVLSARVNLLTRTEEFDNAYWTEAGIATISAGSTVAPDGTSTADTITASSGAGPHCVYSTSGVTVTTGIVHTTVFHVKKNTARYIYVAHSRSGTNYATAVFDLDGTGSTATETSVGSVSGSVSATSIVSLGNGWYRVSLQASATGTSLYATLGIAGAATGNTFDVSGNVTFTAAGTESVYIWGADLRPANAGVGLPAYQRVGAATYGVTNPSVVIGNPDYDTTGFPLYLKFDGTDDFLVSGTISPGSVDKAQVFAGVRKNTDPGLSVVSEYSASTGGNAGAFILAGYNTGYIWRSRGSVDITGAIVTSPAAPSTNVLTGLGDIAGDSAILRSNSTQVASDTGNQGTGNFGSYSVYVGARGGTGSWLNGHLYSLILRFSATNLDAATITATETWVNQRTKAF